MPLNIIFFEEEEPEFEPNFILTVLERIFIMQTLEKLIKGEKNDWDEEMLGFAKKLVNRINASFGPEIELTEQETKQ